MEECKAPHCRRLRGKLRGPARPRASRRPVRPVQRSALCKSAIWRRGAWRQWRPGGSGVSCQRRKGGERRRERLGEAPMTNVRGRPSSRAGSEEDHPSCTSEAFRSIPLRNLFRSFLGAFLPLSSSLSCLCFYAVNRWQFWQYLIHSYFSHLYLLLMSFLLPTYTKKNYPLPTHRTTTCFWQLGICGNLQLSPWELLPLNFKTTYLNRNWCAGRIINLNSGTRRICIQSHVEGFALYNSVLYYVRFCISDLCCLNWWAVTTFPFNLRH